MDTSINITRRAALKVLPIITVTAASSAVIAAPELSSNLSPAPETSHEKILRLTEELRQAVANQQGGDWTANVGLDVGLIMIRVRA